MAQALRIGIVTGSTRPGRNNRAVSEWVAGIAAERDDATFELVDIADYDLPLLDEPVPPSMGKYSKEHTRTWADTVASYDGFVLVSAEYNHAPSAALKNALDYLYQEWNDKAVGFVSYGSVGGIRAVEQLRLIVAELQMASVRAQAALTLAEDFRDYTEFTPRPEKAQEVTTMLDQLVRWAGALAALR